MNYTASVTLTGVDNLSKILGNATTALDRLRLTALGANAPINALNQRLATFATSQAPMAAMTQQIGALSQSLNALATSAVGLRGLTTNISALARVNNAGPSGAFGSSHVTTFTEAITGAMRGLSLFYVRARNIANLFLGGFGIREAASEAIEFTSALETSRLSLAASFLTFKQYKDEQGNVVEGNKAYVMALGEAEQAQTLLRAKVFDTTATFSELAVGYQKVVAAAGKSSATQEDFAQLTVNMSNMATAWGMNLETISNQFQSTLLGVSRVSSRVGGFLRGMGVSPATLKSWKDQGIIVQELNKLLSEFGRIGGDLQETWKGVTSNVEDAFQNMFGEGFKTTIMAAKNALKGLTAELVDVAATRTMGAIQINPEVLAGIQKMSEGIAAIISRVAEFIPAMVQMGLVIGNSVVSSIKLFVDMVAVVGELTAGIGRLVASIPVLGPALKATASIMTSSLLTAALSLGTVATAFVLAGKAATAFGKATEILLTMGNAVLGLRSLSGEFKAMFFFAAAEATQFGAKFMTALTNVLPMVTAIGGALIAGFALATQAVNDYGNTAKRITDQMADARSRTNMELSANKLGISLDPDVSEKLVALGHVKAREALQALHDTYKTGTIDLEMYNRVVTTLIPKQKEHDDLARKQAASVSLLNEQIDRETDKTGKMGLKWDRANALTKLATDAAKENRQASVEEIDSLNRLFDIKEKNMALEERAKANKGNGLQFLSKDSSGTIRDMTSELEELERATGNILSLGENVPSGSFWDMDATKKRLEEAKISAQRALAAISKASHDSALDQIEDDHKLRASRIESAYLDAKNQFAYINNVKYQQAADDAHTEAIRQNDAQTAAAKLKYYSEETKHLKKSYEEQYGLAVTYTEGVEAAYAKLSEDRRPDHSRPTVRPILGHFQLHRRQHLRRPNW